MGSNLPLNILFFVPYAPDRIRTRPFHLIKALASEGHRLTLATLWSNQEEFAATQTLAGHLDGLLAKRSRISRAIWNCAQAFPSSRPIQASYSWSPAMAQGVIRILKERHFDVVHIEHLRGVRYGLLLLDAMAKQGLKHTPVVWDSVDCISTLFRHAAQKSPSLRSRLLALIELSRTKRYEGWLVRRFSRVLVTSKVDRDELVKLAQNWCHRHGVDFEDSTATRVAVVPNGVDLEYFCPNGENREPLTLVISGKMSYHANVTAVLRFVQEVMPRIWTEFPETRLWIVGKNPSRVIQKLGISWSEGQSLSISQNGKREPRILVTGTVLDIRPFLRKATVAVAPIQYGVGIQNKVLEAMACGTPVVATPQAVSALQVQSGRDLIIAETKQDLADSIISMLKNPERRLRLGLSGRNYVEQQHEWRSIARGLIEIYRDASCHA